MKPSNLLLKDSPRTEILVGNCIDLMPELPFKGFDLVFGDPPFNYGVDYGDHKDAWKDDLKPAHYLDFTHKWLDCAIDKMSDRGSLFVNVPDEWAANVALHLQAKGLEMVNWIIWAYRFGQHNRGAFIRGHAHCLYFAKDPKKRIWNPDEVLVDSDRAVVYNDPRTAETDRPGKRLPLSVWGFESNWGRVQGNNKERRPLHENQLPESYMERIIRVASNPDSLCLDCFAGSGTFNTVARALGRPSIGIEINPKFAKSAFERVKLGAVRIADSKSKAG